MKEIKRLFGFHLINFIFDIFYRISDHSSTAFVSSIHNDDRNCVTHAQVLSSTLAL